MVECDRKINMSSWNRETNIQLCFDFCGAINFLEVVIHIIK